MFHANTHRNEADFSVINSRQWQAGVVTLVFLTPWSQHVNQGTVNSTQLVRYTAARMYGWTTTCTDPVRSTYTGTFQQLLWFSVSAERAEDGNCKQTNKNTTTQ